MKPARLLVVLSIALLPSLARAQNSIAYRLGVGAQMTCSTAVPTAVNTRGVLWCKSSDSNKLHYQPPGGADAAVGGGSVTFPLTNGTSTNTYTSAVTDGAAAVGHTFNTSNAFATDGDYVLRLQSNSIDWFTAGRASSANAFTFFGSSNATGAGPLFVKAASGNAGFTLDATGGGGRIYQQYSTAAGEWVMADLTAGQNRWKMDANGALAPYNDNTVNLGLPGNRPAAVYTASLVMPQVVATSGSPTAMLLTGAAHTTLAASVETPDVDLALNRIVQFTGGALTTQRAVVIRAPTYAFTSASTLTTAATVSITGSPVAGTNATLTNKYALNLEGGDLNLNGAGARIIAQHFTGRGTAPSIAVGSAAQLGTSPSAAVTTGTDTSGTLTITTGTGPTALVANTSILGATVTFNSTYTSAPKGCVLVPSAAVSAAISTGTNGIAFYCDQASSTTGVFVVRVVSPTAATLAASTGYQFAYHVIQ